MGGAEVVSLQTLRSVEGRAAKSQVCRRNGKNQALTKISVQMLWGGDPDFVGLLIFFILLHM